MIHIKNSQDGQFYVVVISKNGEVLSTSETLKTRRSAYKNILAMMKAFGTYSKLLVRLNDHTYKAGMKVTYLCPNGKKETTK